MRASVVIHDNSTAASNYVSWTPSPAVVRLTDTGGATGPVDVVLRNEQEGVGGQLVFYASPGAAPSPTLAVQLPLDGSPVAFRVGGKFGAPSVADRDAAIAVTVAGAPAPLVVLRLMVRVRKNADKLTPPERERFIAALAALNDRGAGRFRELRQIHSEVVWNEAHGHAGFLPWHRAYLLDLERELQAIDPSVSLPYWRFDEPAPNLFSPRFLGAAAANGQVTFAADNPLQFWSTDSGAGIVREPSFDTATESVGTLSEAQTLGVSDKFFRFTRLETGPHGAAHMACGGFLADGHNAPRDPLFFLLHGNVDRLWAKWQWLNKRHDVTDVDTYPNLGAAAPGSDELGRHLRDTMWPWNQDSNPPRPTIPPPGGALAESPILAAPGATPTVGAMIDYQGVRNPAHRLGFDYDDVPYEQI